ncbi:MAG TPA: di-heme oxidoredictase family protein [Polyangium sp.]|nr:di-heme oxidoredictase family protein [Polyangium sp.]
MRWLVFPVVCVVVGCGAEAPPGETGPSAEPGEELSGGETTVHDTSKNAYSLSARNMTAERRSAFFVGNSFFKENWVIAPSSTAGRDGLGPLFNARSCSSCHLLDGRGSPPDDPAEPLVSVLLRLSIPGTDAHGGPAPEPTYGGQLQPRAIPGVMPEGDAFVAYEEMPGSFPDGETYSLRKPIYTIAAARGDMQPGTLVSPRVAPVMIGLGLLEAVAEEDILRAEDPDDADGDGISGRANHVWDVVRGAASLGRFGWKANQPTLMQQTAGAFHGDIGITTSLFLTEDCTDAQADCKAAPTGGAPEASEKILADVAFYSTTLAVPARRDVADPVVLAGKRHFLELGCGKCHTPVFHTGTFDGYPELSGQTIRPFTDLLLHDMGEALADDRPDFKADGREWRTAPLWGIGLLRVVNGHENLLHDGRARGFVEAVLWHGGEAEGSREAFRALPAEERRALVRFLESL